MMIFTWIADRDCLKSILIWQLSFEAIFWFCALEVEMILQDGVIGNKLSVGVAGIDVCDVWCLG